MCSLLVHKYLGFLCGQIKSFKQWSDANWRPIQGSLAVCNEWSVGPVSVGDVERELGPLNSAVSPSDIRSFSLLIEDSAQWGQRSTRACSRWEMRKWQAVAETVPLACLVSSVSKAVCVHPTPSFLDHGETECHEGRGRCSVKQSSSFHDGQETERRGPETNWTSIKKINKRPPATFILYINPTFQSSRASTYQHCGPSAQHWSLWRTCHCQIPMPPMLSLSNPNTQ